MRGRGRPTTRTRRAGMGVVAALCAAGSLGLGVAAPAGASARASGHAGRTTSHDGAHSHHHGRHHALPVIGHAKDLSAEPVVHAGRGKPPKRLLVRNLVVGHGATATASSVVEVKYVGANFRNGRDFTAQTWTSGHATTFPLRGVIPGFAKGLVGMRVGGRREIVIPPKLGYQNHAQGPITANETLVFVVDLVGVKG